MTDAEREYLRSLARAHLLAPAHSREEDALAETLELAAERLGVTIGDWQEDEIARLQRDGFTLPHD